MNMTTVIVVSVVCITAMSAVGTAYGGGVAAMTAGISAVAGIIGAVIGKTYERANITNALNKLNKTYHKERYV